ncbi:avidin/streptavidin family protein [Burkholderia anthina]|uniref:Avidin family protein n=1 Tax=Burkholderia anthina TaxID=179879 RepID=A0AAW3PW77_9BURK|nr:avidin/streptavidin family protein [Burkholderia anthina]KVE08916.1 avidin family protein [Burkholderia anthina]KWZ33130.1 avidin family protein [Burkholderia anthina]
MNWIGTWRNQYGSTLSITDDKAGAIRGVFSTALRDSAFFGHDLPVSGVWFDDCINFAFGISDGLVSGICSFTGMLRDGKLETVWHVVTSKAPRQGSRALEMGWAHAVQTNADTFERVAG